MDNYSVNINSYLIFDPFTFFVVVVVDIFLQLSQTLWIFFGQNLATGEVSKLSSITASVIPLDFLDITGIYIPSINVQ